ncbi:hypothetical protein APC04_00970 [Acinetobacter baumannii]|nr:hypothetical protein APC04_00970 [Acinetobacter baumannii]KRJ34912.1 hypothetical protein APC83_06340 [Acinetobacter baumannii]
MNETVPYARPTRYHNHILIPHIPINMQKSKTPLPICKKSKKVNEKFCKQKRLKFSPHFYIIFLLQLTALLVSTTRLDTSKMLSWRKKVKAIKWMT